MKKNRNLAMLALGLLLSLTSIQTYACNAPTNVTVTLNGGFSVHFAWDAVTGADSYNYQMYHASSPEKGPIYPLTSNSVDLTLLFCGDYYFDVQAVCNGTPSSWTSHFFATPTSVCLPAPSCSAPGSFSETYNSSTNAYDISWSSMSNNYFYIRFKPSASGTWGELNYAGTNGYSSSIQDCDDYDYQVQHICGPGFFSSFASTQTYTPQTAPDGLFESNITKTTATLDWNAVPGATYSIQYRRIGQGWITVTSSSNQKTITGLKKNRTYEWKVAAKCGTVVGPYSPVETFTTPNSKMDEEAFEAIATEIQLVPNPANQTASLHISLEDAAQADVTIYDMAGKRISYQSMELAGGSHEMPLSVAEMKNGVYFVSVTLSSGDKMMKKLVVLH